MKRILLMLLLAACCFAPALVPSTANGQISIEIGDRPYYHGDWYWGPNHGYRYYWVPGHWAWAGHRRYWVHGHYVNRSRRYWR